MRKIPTIFERDWNGDRSRVLDKQNPVAAWVFAGEGIPTRKIDGTCCLVRDSVLYKRRELKATESAPAGFEPVDFDQETGKRVGWVPVMDDPTDKWHLAAFATNNHADGTYELVGPKVQGNPEHYVDHRLVPHSALRMIEDVPRDFAGLAVWFAGRDIEGIVWHHPDGRMAKIKMRDFGLRRTAR